MITVFLWPSLQGPDNAEGFPHLFVSDAFAEEIPRGTLEKNQVLFSRLW